MPEDALYCLSLPCRCCPHQPLLPPAARPCRSADVTRCQSSRSFRRPSSKPAHLLSGLLGYTRRPHPSPAFLSLSPPPGAVAALRPASTHSARMSHPPSGEVVLCQQPTSWAEPAAAADGGKKKKKKKGGAGGGEDGGSESAPSAQVAGAGRAGPCCPFAWPAGMHAPVSAGRQNQPGRPCRLVAHSLPRCAIPCGHSPLPTPPHPTPPPPSLSTPRPDLNPSLAPADLGSQSGGA